MSAASAGAAAVIGLGAAPSSSPPAIMGQIGPASLRPVVIAIPYRGATAATGIEALGENLDVFAEELGGHSMDFHLLTRALPPPASSTLKSGISKPFECSAVDPTAVPAAPWYSGQRVDFSLDARELALLRQLSAPGAATPPQYVNGVNIIALLQKLHVHGTAAAAHTDRLLNQQYITYTKDIPQLRQRTINAEQALHESNLRIKNLAEQLQLATTSAARVLPLGSLSAAGGGGACGLSLTEARELDLLRRQRDALVPVLRQVREALVCPICTEVALLPKVLGACGHVACQSCLKQLDEVAFATLTASAGGASARQHLMARRCPLCRMEIIGGGFPVHPLKEVATALVANQLIEPTDIPTAVSAHSTQRLMEFKTMVFEKDTPEAKHIHALQMGCYAQSQLSQHSVSGVVAAVTPDQWINGVYVLFEPAVSRVFFETFATTLHGKAGGVNVLVNSAQRMLAVQLADRNKQRRNNVENHLLVKVATDGRFTIGHAPESKVNG
ncbi:MAG TPA: hypothetical protein VFG51_01010 [Candidatus Saccharimonadia bacterium]|nr:hypothetical protein [Candidatus Saccharimonadia bacterium]